MKRANLIRHLEKNGCEFLREGGNHTVYVNRKTQKSTSRPGIAKLTNSSVERFARIFRS